MLLTLLLKQGTTNGAPYLTIVLVGLALLALLLVALGKLSKNGPSVGRLLLLVGVLAFIVLVAAIFF